MARTRKQEAGALWPAPESVPDWQVWNRIPAALRPAWSRRTGRWLPEPSKTAKEAYDSAYYWSSVATPPKPRLGVRNFRRAVREGCFDAMHDLAVQYWNGDGVRRDRETALRLFSAAHRLGDSVAGFALARCYVRMGRRRRAYALYRRLAEAGYIPAFSLLAEHLVERRDSKSRKEAAKWWERVLVDPVDVAQKRDAQYQLAVLFELGRGVRRDLRHALRLYRAAAANGDGDACLNLGWIYRNGAGVRADPERGLAYYKRAAEHGVASAMFNLGLEYEEGKVVRRSRERAKRWFALAAKAGHKKARRHLRRIDSGSV